MDLYQTPLITAIKISTTNTLVRTCSISKKQQKYKEGTEEWNDGQEEQGNVKKEMEVVENYLERAKLGRKIKK